ncbi:MAG TPA: hypothetical protein VE244_14580 [Nitrososphaeraceae archaeon]|nr:hypothetical protein [Nitrososphaeraceae archaeon]
MVRTIYGVYENVHFNKVYAEKTAWTIHIKRKSDGSKHYRENEV